MIELDKAREAFLETRLGKYLADQGYFYDADDIDEAMLETHAVVERHQGPDESCKWCDGKHIYEDYLGEERHVTVICKHCNVEGKVPGRWWPNRETMRAYNIIVGAHGLPNRWEDSVVLHDLLHTYGGTPISIDRIDRKALADALQEG